MRRALRLAACLLGAAPALAQEPPGPLPEGPATLRGRIVHETGGAVASLPVVLYAAPAEGVPGLGRTVSDASGAFAFENLSNAPGLAYLVGVRAEELPFGVRVEFAPGQTLREVEVRIAPPLADASGVERPAARLRIERGCGGLRVVETHELRNPADRPVVVPESRREGAAALLELELPAGAGPLSLPFGSQGLEQEGARVAFWGPLHPGVHEIEFAYSIPTPDGSARLGWRLPRGVDRLEVWTHADGPRVAAAGLAPGPERTFDGRRYATLAAGPLAPGAALDLALELPAVAPAALAVSEARTWLELDDAALVVDAEYRLAVAGDAPLAADSDAPLLCVSLPPGAEALRFSPETLAMGADPDPSGELALRGPIPNGASVVALRYRVPVAGEAVELAPRFDRGAGALSVFVADTGVAVETARLHRRRPIQTADRTFLHLEGFEIEPGESVPLRLVRLAPRRPPSRLATLGFSVALAAAGIGFLIGPLRVRRDEPAVDPVLAQLEIERESIVAALRGLEEDFETGKLDAPDHEELRGELRARAAELIQRREAAAARPRAERAAVAKPACAACAAELPPDARFCHRCGAAVAGGPG
jgi:hypothetical protein